MNVQERDVGFEDISLDNSKVIGRHFEQGYGNSKWGHGISEKQNQHTFLFHSSC